MSWFWKKKKTKEVIKKSCYDKLPVSHQVHYESTNDIVTHHVIEDDGNFALSMLIAETTGNPFLGAAVGGNFTGAMVGDKRGR